MPAEAQLAHLRPETMVEGLSDLLRERAAPCVSIYCPAKSQAATRNLAAAEWKALVSNLESRLGDFFPGRASVGEFVEPARAFLQDFSAVRGGASGCALFLAPGFFHSYCLFEAPSEKIEVGRQFLIRPLLPYLTAGHRFYVLALSQKLVRLFEATLQGIQQVRVEEIPESLRADFEGESFQRETQLHTASPAILDKRGAIFHGARTEQKERILHFFRRVDEGIAKRLTGQSAPLVVAAVPYLFPIYQKANSYPHLLGGFVAGSPDLEPPEALCSAAWTEVRRQGEAERERDFALFKELNRTGRSSSNLREIVAGAAAGLVQLLFVPEAGERWGSFLPPDTVHVHQRRQEGDEELLNLAAVLTLRHGGSVHPAPAAWLPEGAPLAAIFRF